MAAFRKVNDTPSMETDRKEGTPMSYLNLAAEAAKTEEDLRIARKHLDIAGQRDLSRADNAAAFEMAQAWVVTCYQANDDARGAMIAGWKPVAR